MNTKKMDEKTLRELLEDEEPLPEILKPKTCGRCGSLLCPDTEEGGINYLCPVCPTPE